MCHFIQYKQPAQMQVQYASNVCPLCSSVLAITFLWGKIQFGENSTLLGCAFLPLKETSETSYGIQYVRPSVRSRSIWPGDPLGVSGVTQSLKPALHIQRAIFSLQHCVSKMDASTSVCNPATVFMNQTQGPLLLSFVYILCNCVYTLFLCLSNAIVVMKMTVKKKKKLL